MERFERRLVIFCFALMLLSPLAMAESVSELLEEGVYAEEIEGDMTKAIKLFNQVIDSDTDKRIYLARAMYHKGMCLLKLRKENEARETFEELKEKFKEQTQIIERVNAILEDLSVVDPSALMPADTLMYMEIGSPGKQVEKILDMLKGTPFENPLAMMGQGQEKTPGDIAAAILNPNTLAELKKIRGMAVGIVEFQQNNPSMIAVLYPGKSDVLKSLIMTGLGFAGKPDQPIEGMQTLNIENAAGVAYDEDMKIIIIAQPKHYLEEAVKQYKGISQKPNLTTNSQFTEKLPKKVRQENTLTLWADIDRIYGEAKDMIPEEMLAAEVMMDLPNVDDLLAYFSLQEHGVSLDLEINFKDGHQCLTYNMIHTPALSATGFEGVPEDAFALISGGFSEENSMVVEKMRKPLNRITGLDLGRELFANIEQINVFLLPEAIEHLESPLQLLGNIGISITSHDPQQTSALFTQMLGTAQKMVPQAESPSASEGLDIHQYHVATSNEIPIILVHGQAGRSNILAFNEDVVKKSIHGIKTQRSVLQGKALSRAMKDMKNTTSKAVYVNVGGLLHMIGPVLLQDVEEDQQETVQMYGKQLADACGNTILELRTDEDINQFQARINLSGLPIFDQVYIPMMKINEAVSHGHKQQAMKKWGKSAAAVIGPTTTSITIDGEMEEAWLQIPSQTVSHCIYQSHVSPEDCSAEFRALYDKDNLYVFVDVKDDMVQGKHSDFYENDGVEIYIDPQNDKASPYYQFYITWQGDQVHIGEYQNNDTYPIRSHALVKTEDGYHVEVEIPWERLGIKPVMGQCIGLEVHINDSDNEPGRDCKLSWYGQEDEAYNTPGALGFGCLQGLVGWWKFDETEGTKVTDSSGNGHDGVVLGQPKWAPDAGKISGALECDGFDDYIKLPKDLGQFSHGFTAICWAKPTGVGNWARFFEIGNGPSQNNVTLGRKMKSNDLCLEVYTGDMRGPEILAENVIELNQWQCFAATLNEKGDAILYKNGKPLIHGQTSAIPDAVREKNFIGHTLWQVNEPFKGFMDEVRLYNYALKPDTIMRLYQDDTHGQSDSD